MAVGAWFLVLCPECPLDEVHDDIARARRVARDHHHAGATLIGMAAIREDRAHTRGRHQLGLILTAAVSPTGEKKTAPTRKPSRLRWLLAQCDVA